MRYLGNKTPLLAEIERACRRLGFTQGTVCDLFAGSGVVSRHFRSLGNRVLATDLMRVSYLFQQVYLEIVEAPTFEGVRRDLDLPRETTETLTDPRPRQLDLLPKPTQPNLPGDWSIARRVLRHLEQGIPPVQGLLTRQYSPDGPADRRYFRPETASRLDAMLGAVREWWSAGKVTDLEASLLTASIVDGGDRRANISGTYGAYLKKWQANTTSPVSLRLPSIHAGPPGHAANEDVMTWIERQSADLAYLDPPYNGRQYPSNYHLLNLMARIPGESDLPGLEASIYGKTGLVPWKSEGSALCSRKGTVCRDAFRELLLRIQAPRIVISYSEEGIIARDQFEDMLAEYAGVAVSRLGSVLTEIPYRRFRSDADSASRKYKQVEGRARNEVCEWLFHVERKQA